MNIEQQTTQNRLWIAVINLDLQLYKGSIYKLRWGTPGGIDQALPCYDEALRTLESTDWPASMRGDAAVLADRVAQFKQTLKARDVTIASAQQTRMTEALDDLREAVRHWPNARPATRRGSEGARDQAVRAGMEAPSATM